MSSADPQHEETSLDEIRAVNVSRRKRRTVLIGSIAGVVVVALGATGTALAVGAATSPPRSEVTVAVQLLPDNLDIRTTTGVALNQVLIDNVYEGLVSRDAAGTISPSLAKEWAISEDGLRYTFSLHEGTRFSNGDALTADDVVWSLTDVIDNALADSTALAQVDSVTAADDTTVVISLTKPDPELLYKLAGRAGLVLDPDATNDRQTTAVGSGPFVVERFTAGDSIVLARDAEHWGEKARIGTAVFQLFADGNAIVNALNAGSVQFGAVDKNLRSQVEGNSAFTLQEGFASDKFTLAFNNAAAPLDDIRVRQAIRAAIDHDAIVAALGGGKTLYGPIVDSDPGYEDLRSIAPHDIAKAKRLLAEAGYPNGLTLNLTIPSLYGSTIPDLLTSQLAEAGITLKVGQVEFPTWLSEVHANKNFQLSIVDHAEARDFANWANPEYYFGYDNDRVQALYAEASTATSASAHAEALAKAARIVSEEAAGDWLVNPTTLVAVDRRLGGVPVDSTSSRLDLTRATFEG